MSNNKNYFGKRNFAHVKWYVLKDGKTKIRGSFELLFGNWLIDNGIEFKPQPRKPKIGYTTPRTKANKVYIPDFYIIANWDGYNGSYIEISNKYDLRKGSDKERKLRYVRKQNPDIQLHIITKDEMEELGIDVSRKNINKMKEEFLND